MSTKNLARTVVEGGRTGWWKEERDGYTNRERSQERDYLRLVQQSDDPDDVDVPAPKRVPAGKEFDDNLRPMYRFLDSRVGQSWNNVYREVCQRFDSRKLRDWHLVIDHLSRSVKGSGVRSWYSLYFVDKKGILRKSKLDRNGSGKGQPWAPWEVCAWLGNRRIRQASDEKFFWLDPTRTPNVGTDYHRGQFRQVMLDESGDYKYEHVLGHFAERTWSKGTTYWVEPRKERIEVDQPYRQGSEFSREDYSYFLSLPKSVQDKLTVHR